MYLCVVYVVFVSRFHVEVEKPTFNSLYLGISHDIDTYNSIFTLVEQPKRLVESPVFICH